MSEKPEILAINPGSTSTKIALYAGEELVFATNVRHAEGEMQRFRGRPVLDQLDFRWQEIKKELQERGTSVKRLAAVVGRGGLLKPVAGGTYTVNAAMLRDLRAARRGDHAANLGAFLADAIARSVGVPAFIVDPVSVDEWPEVARLSGLLGLERECLSHALNTKAVAKRYARERGKSYEELRLIVVHAGSGISVSAHEGGRMVDVTNSREEGAFSTERAGGVPAMKLVQWCFAGTHTREQIEERLFREGGAYSYLGTRDLAEVLARVEKKDAAASLVFEAMVYQIAKEVGAMAAVLGGRVGAVLVTGGMAKAEAFCEALRQRVEWIAPVAVYPGEDELQALAEGAMRVLRGEEKAREYVGEARAAARQ